MVTEVVSIATGVAGKLLSGNKVAPPPGDRAGYTKLGDEGSYVTVYRPVTVYYRGLNGGETSKLVQPGRWRIGQGSGDNMFSTDPAKHQKKAAYVLNADAGALSPPGANPIADALTSSATQVATTLANVGVTPTTAGGIIDTLLGVAPAAPTSAPLATSTNQTAAAAAPARVPWLAIVAAALLLLFLFRRK